MIENPKTDGPAKPEAKPEVAPVKVSMTVAEAGRKGGIKVASERGREFFEQIGRKGGEKVARERGREFFEEIGRKGGEKVRALIEKGKQAGREQAAKEQAGNK
jgi:general stress protein YciG